MLVRNTLLRYIVDVATEKIISPAKFYAPFFSEQKVVSSEISFFQLKETVRDGWWGRNLLD